MKEVGWDQAKRKSCLGSTFSSAGTAFEHGWEDRQLLTKGG